MDSNTEALENRAIDLLLGEDGPAAEEPVDELVEAAQEPVEPEEVPVESEGDEEVVEAQEEADDAVDDDLVEFEFEGQLIEAPTVIKEALMRQSDYTQKTQDLAAQRKAVEVVQGEVETVKKQYEFAQSVQPDILKAQQLEATVDEYGKYLREHVENLSSAETMKIQLAIEDAKKQRDEIVGGLNQKQQEFQQAQEQAHEELLNKGTEILRSKFPNWGEDAQKQVREYALNLGFSEAEISGVVDPRQVETLYKASMYDALQAGKSAAVQKVQEAPRVASKARNPMPKETQDKLNLRKKLKSNKLTQREKTNAVIEDIGARWG